MLRDALVHPDLSDAIADWDDGIRLVDHPAGKELLVPGTIAREQAAALEETVWERLHFARHLRHQRLGEFTIANDLHRSESLALVQLLILYHLVTTRASVALGGGGTRVPCDAAHERPELATADAHG